MVPLWALSVLPFFWASFVRSYEDSQAILSSPNDILDTCTLLNGLFPDQLFFPNSSGYDLRQSQYWSVQQSAIEPACRYTPKNEADLRLAFHILKQRGTQIAIESGGHSSNPGGSNIETGVTIDLLYFSFITLTDRNTAVWLGPAARWQDVYATLQSHGLTVSGGRVGSVGVGGYILGGGFSWFANERGWTCDSVLEFEVLTPSGQLLHARKDWNADLFWALKGSLGAFGLVTAIKVPTIPDRAIYGGAISYEPDQAPALFHASNNLAENAHLDLKSQGYLSFGYLLASQRHLSSAYLVNTAGDTSPEAFDHFVNIKHTHSSLQSTSFFHSAKEIGSSNPLGYRRSKFTLTAYCSVEVMQVIHSAFASLTSHLSPDTENNSMLGITLQPLTTEHLEAGLGNIFSLNPGDAPLLLLSAEMWWQDESQDEYYEQQMRNLHQAWKQSLQHIKKLHHWVYPNYAASWQNPLSAEALSPETLESLSEVRKKYDPEDMWRKLVPGSLHVESI